MMKSFLSYFRYVDPFCRYSRSKSKVVKNRAEYWTIFSLPNFWGQVFQKLYPGCHLCLTARHLEKFCEDTTTSPEVINTLNFRPN